MIIICEDCGKKYRIDPSKLQGRSARFKCKACNHLIQLPESTPAGGSPAEDEWESTQTIRPTAADDDPDSGVTQDLSDNQNIATSGGHGPEVVEPLVTYTVGFTENDTVAPGEETLLSDDALPISARHSLRLKMMILFLVLPMTLFAISSALFLIQTNRLEHLLTDESARIVNRMAEEKIAELSRAVAAQCELYLTSKPNLKKEKFAKDDDFKALSVQKVGTTGYTALYEQPGKDGIWRTWSHVQPKIIGIDMANLKEPLGRNFDGFWQVFTGVKDGKEARGYYTWKDSNGRLRNKFMVCTPIEGTRYVIAATTYLEELTQSVDDLKVRSHTLAKQVLTTTTIILVVTLVMIGAIVLFYGYRLTRRIRELTEVTNRISIGEMNAEISVRAKDEIGELAEAISRMQESIRLSIDRLQSRR